MKEKKSNKSTIKVRMCIRIKEWKYVNSVNVNGKRMREWRKQKKGSWHSLLYDE
jgi:hypothetical protein